MKTDGDKTAALRTMRPSVSSYVKIYADGEDPRVRAMWDEEFFGHELPPNYKISHIPEKSREQPDVRYNGTGERATWDEEFLGHHRPSNYVISRFQTPEGLEKKSSKGRREDKDPRGQHVDESYGHLRLNIQDTFEYNFDKTVDNYVLSEEISGACKDACDIAGRGAAVSTITKEKCGKGETFEERALRFGVEDWNLVGNKKWPQNACKVGSKRSSHRGIFHSPSGSDTSSMISTLESSSFSYGSEGSSFAKTDFSTSSVNFSHVYTIPLSAIGRHPFGLSEERTAEEFVELNISDRERLEDESVAIRGTELKNGSSYLQFNFLDGKMVESEDVDDGNEGEGGNVQMKMDGSTCSEHLPLRSAAPFANAYQALGPILSPENESFFTTFPDSDWLGTHSTSTIDHGHACLRDADPAGFDEDIDSNFSEDHAYDDWRSDTPFSDANPPVTPFNPPSSSGRKHNRRFLSDAEGKAALAGNSRPEVDKVSPAVKSLSSEERSNAKSPKKIGQGTTRKTRSLGSVLSHHLAFTAVPSLRYCSQPSLTSDQKQSPTKVTAACIEWLWSEKDAMKPVQALRALAERENSERERSGSTPPVRSLDSAFKESRTNGLGRSQSSFNNRAPVVYRSPKRVESLAGSSQKYSVKESRESILASWAAVYSAGDSGATRAKRPSMTSKVSLTAPSMRHCSKGGISPRKRSVSFGAQTGSKSKSPLSKQPVSKSLAMELEVLCRPFGPVLKRTRFLPTSKRGLGRPPLFSNPGSQLASRSSSSSIPLPALLKGGRLQCVVSRDGLPSYSLIMDETEEIFAAKGLRGEAMMQEGVSHVYTFHSFKGKGKGKSSWRQWGKKEKPGSDFAGYMTLTSSICPIVSSNGVQNFVESEFVLFDANMKEISILGPTTSSYPRSSFSSWDTVTPQRSPQDPSSTYSSPSSTYFSLPSPIGAVSTPGPANSAGTTTPSKSDASRCVSFSFAGGVPVRGSTNLDKGVSHVKQLERHLSLTSPVHPTMKLSNLRFHEGMSDSEIADDHESQTWVGLPQAQSELAAVVVRMPLEKAQGKSVSVGGKWGWGINFLRKSFDGTKGGSFPDHGCAAEGDSLSSKNGICKNATTTCQVLGMDSIKTCNNPLEQRCSTCTRIAGEDEQSHGGLNITLILPSGEHGCSVNAIDGPQPLIERWRSGGKCDCGSWDLGCGLTIVDTIDTPSGRGQLQDNTLRLYVEGKKQMVGLTLSPLKEGCYTLAYQAPISPLHAFATAVAVLQSRDPIIAAKKAAETRKRLTRIPVKVVPASARSFCRITDEPSGSRSFTSYKLVCPDPPSSPFGRA